MKRKAFDKYVHHGGEHKPATGFACIQYSKDINIGNSFTLQLDTRLLTGNMHIHNK